MPVCGLCATGKNNYSWHRIHNPRLSIVHSANNPERSDGKTGGEDPAYEIIRHAIKKRKSYENPLDSFTCDAYIKTLIRSRSLPSKILGKTFSDEDRKDLGVDSEGRGIIYLSESLTRIAFKKPDKVKLEVISGRESGSNGYGFNFPTFINFYNNNVNIFITQLSPRGYVSPIADGALNYYKYKFLGSFIEDGKEINQIRVIPKRRFEPLFLRNHQYYRRRLADSQSGPDAHQRVSA